MAHIHTDSYLKMREATACELSLSYQIPLRARSLRNLLCAMAVSWMRLSLHFLYFSVISLKNGVRMNQTLYYFNSWQWHSITLTKKKKSWSHCLFKTTRATWFFVHSPHTTLQTQGHAKELCKQHWDFQTTNICVLPFSAPGVTCFSQERNLDQEIRYYQFLKPLASHSGGKSSFIAYGHSFT